MKLRCDGPFYVGTNDTVIGYTSQQTRILHSFHLFVIQDGAYNLVYKGTSLHEVSVSREAIESRPKSDA
jgi:hypothetical protein